MRLYLSAESKNKITYTPDWLKVTYEEDGKMYDLVLDIQGSIDYQKERLSCRCKGDLIPWVLWNCETGEEIDLSLLTEEECEIAFPNKRIAEIVCNSDTFEIGVYPVDDNDEICELAMDDVFSDCEGFFEIYVDADNYCTKEFTFDTEVNV